MTAMTTTLYIEVRSYKIKFPVNYHYAAFTGKTGKYREGIGKISGNYSRQTSPVLSNS